MKAYRSVFLSDLHLGARWCKAKDLAAFLSGISCERLYLVGDILDGWKPRRKGSRFLWHQRVLQELLRISRKSSVIYVTGNHDSFLKEHHGKIFGNVGICRRVIHSTADGRQMLVLHGDEFDAVMTHSPWLARLGDLAYDGALWVNWVLNGLRTSLGMRYWSLSQFLKHRVKDAVNFLSEFEEHLSREMVREKLDGIICGHIHRPELKKLKAGLYANCGDWVESCSALVEQMDGTLQLLHWHEEKALSPGNPPLGEHSLPAVLSPEEAQVFKNLWGMQGP
jgi:UDP-2,3-diacylglucosamine pyrophosphatase LpxH